MVDLLRFGIDLIVSGDLDPVQYILKHLHDTDPERASAWFLTFTYFGDIETANDIMVEAGTRYDSMYWAAFETVASIRAGRSDLRQHFQGHVAIEATKQLFNILRDPRRFIHYTVRSGRNFNAIETQLRNLPQMGPGSAWRAMSLLEGAFGVDLEFPPALYTQSDAMSYVQAAAARLGEPSGAHAIRHCLDAWAIYDAPPTYRRPVAVQETFRIFLKWMHAEAGRYSLGDETAQFFAADLPAPLLASLPKIQFPRKPA